MSEFSLPLAATRVLRAHINDRYRTDEGIVVEELLSQIRLSPDQLDRIALRSRELVTKVRADRIGKGGLDAFMHHYQLSSEEGVVLMCLAEALLRIPDDETADRLIRDKIGNADWERHLGRSDSLFVNASTWALMLTGRVVGLKDYSGQSLGAVLGGLANRLGEPIIRESVTQGMRILGRQFVTGRTIEEALARAEGDPEYRYSFDMLGEAARTDDDAKRYLAAYADALDAIGKAKKPEHTDPIHAHGISVKLSALHPRYEHTQHARILDELTPRLLHLCKEAKRANIGLTVDAEESDRLDLSLDLIERVLADPTLDGWHGFGLAVQAYQKRALPLIDWLAQLAEQHSRRLMVRLVKGAYWDSEIKWAQEDGAEGYPVFTRKATTDVSYLACARKLLDHHEHIYPQFATHNAHTLSTLLELTGNEKDFEFQRLHGMGEVLYEHVLASAELAHPCRIYAPVGGHEELLAYLVRRLLENGANTSFVNRIVDERAPLEELIADPVAKVRKLEQKSHPRIPLPEALFSPQRSNSRGLDLSDRAVLPALYSAMQRFEQQPWTASPIIGGVESDANAQDTHAVSSPANRAHTVGHVSFATLADVNTAVTRAVRGHRAWCTTRADERAQCLERAAALMEQERAELMAIAILEAGKTLPDAVAEVREAIDFCNYYAMQCRSEFSEPVHLRGPTGERNELSLRGRGVFACISPWNFPLAIFMGQVSAALAAGNAVVAKPAEQTSLIAAYATRLLHRAGVPGDVLHLVPGDGAQIGQRLVEDPRIAGVAFTGSTEIARHINRVLAAKNGPIVPLIAETGGQNAMIVDSSALAEQVVQDVVMSAFQSAGQRCSALRVLYVQDDVADRVITMLVGAMRELSVGNPVHLSTDVGPVIDDAALARLHAHALQMQDEAKLLFACELGSQHEGGTFFAPHAFEIDSIAVLEREVFGPILHVVRFDGGELDDVVDAINETGYGLTLSIHSRIDSTIKRIRARARVGNVYVNRNQIGAVVGVQPFGGERLSGTGPKAGGPHYLPQFATERALSVNLTAQGGNTDLMSLAGD